MLNEDAAKRFDAMVGKPPEQRRSPTEIRHGNRPQPAGNTMLFYLQWIHRSAESGLMIGDPAVWDRGKGTDALELVLPPEFHQPNLKFIFLHVAANKPRARRSYEKAGSLIEGALRQAVFLHGRHPDTVLMSILKSKSKRS